MFPFTMLAKQAWGLVHLIPTPVKPPVILNWDIEHHILDWDISQINGCIRWLISPGT